MEMFMLWITFSMISGLAAGLSGFVLLGAAVFGAKEFRRKTAKAFFFFLIAAIVMFFIGVTSNPNYPA